MFAQIKNFNKTIWLIIIATFASRFVLYMAWPFLAILLHDNFGLNPFEIGFFLFASSIVGTLTSFYLGYLSDIFGRRKIILTGLLINIVSMIMIGLAYDLTFLFLGTMFYTIAHGMVEAPGRALMTDMTDARETKDMALHVRYFALNVGAAMGPLLGTYIGVTGNQHTFLILGAVYVVYFGVALFIFNSEAPLKHTKAATSVNLRTTVTILSKDHVFLLFVLANFLCFLTYAQIDAGLIQYLQQEKVQNITTLYAGIIFINGMTIVFFQFPALKLLETTSPFIRAMIGTALFAAGFLGFGIAPTAPYYYLYAAIFILSLGEVVLFPTLNILIDRIAPDELKGSYFGAATSLSSFGKVFAPLIGGYLLFQFGGLTLWLVMTGLAILIAFIYQVADKLSKHQQRIA